MNKKFLSVILFSALMVGTAGTFTSCKDYDDDIESLDNRVSAVEKLVSDLQAKIDAGSVITGVDKTEDGIVIKLSNGESYPIKNGTNGTNAPVWSIVKDANGDYWWAKDNVQTEFPARGEKGEPGNGSAGQDAKTIYYYPGTEETGKLHGQAEAGYWVKVTEEKGKDPLYEVQTTKWLPEGTLSAVWNTKDETLTLGNMKDENGKLVEKTISLTTKLKALVFIPDLYEDGVEATKYKYANGDFIEAEKNAIESHIGTLDCNSNLGIYGQLDSDELSEYAAEDTYYPVAGKDEIHTGSAQMISEISGKLEKYNLEITNIDKKATDTNKGMELKVTDDRLIELSGGIVQGTSGSPIIQDGKIIGAVTHVFVDDPTGGYGICIDEML